MPEAIRLFYFQSAAYSNLLKDITQESLNVINIYETYPYKHLT